MTTDLLRYIIALCLASSLGMIVVLLLRRAARMVFGPIASYSTWLLVPVAMVAVMVPHAGDAGSELSVRLQTNTVSALAHAFSTSADSATRPGSSVDWVAWTLTTWAVGAVLVLSYFIGLQRAFVRRLGRLSGARRILRAEHGVGCPAVLGIFRPKVVLPVDFQSRFTRLERSLIISHERRHLRHGDTAWNAFNAVMRCLFWFNPLVHLASICFRLDQELACDAAVLGDFPRSRRTYANAMLKTQMLEVALPVGCNWQSAYHLKERLKMVKDAVSSHRRRTFGRVSVVVASLVVGFSVWAAEPATAIKIAVDDPAANTHSAAPTPTKYPVRFSGTGVFVARTADFTRVAGAEFQLWIAPEVEVRFQSDRDAEESDGSRILEGHVSITATRSADQATSTDSQLVIAKVSATKAVVTRESGGGFKVRLEHGSLILPKENPRKQEPIPSLKQPPSRR